jgi:Domain of unknown function (DUF4926)
MPFGMYGKVILTRDILEDGLRAGDVGTAVERHVVPGVPKEGYSVEFFDMTRNTVAVVTLPASALRLPTPADRPSVRASARKPRRPDQAAFRSESTPLSHLFLPESQSARQSAYDPVI